MGAALYRVCLNIGASMWVVFAKILVDGVPVRLCLKGTERRSEWNWRPSKKATGQDCEISNKHEIRGRGTKASKSAQEVFLAPIYNRPNPALGGIDPQCSGPMRK